MSSTVKNRPPQSVSQDAFSWKNVSLYLAILTVLIVCLLLLEPFTLGITGAIVLATVTNRPYRWLRRKVRNDTWAAVIALTLISLTLVLLSSFFVQELGERIAGGVRTLQNGGAERHLDDLLARYPRLGSLYQRASELFDFRTGLHDAASFLGTRLFGALGGSLSLAMQSIIMLFLLFFLYRDERFFLNALYAKSPLSPGESRFVIGRVRDTIRATVAGRFLVALLQGIVAGALFAIIGLDEAPLLGLLTVIFAMIPAFGAFLVWLPVAVWLAATGHWWQMLIVAGTGVGIISMLDNFLYPVLVGARLRQHTVVIFISLLGGTALFGLSGLVLGPVTFSVAESLLMVWQHNRRKPARC